MSECMPELHHISHSASAPYSALGEEECH